ARRRGAVQSVAVQLPLDMPLVRADATLAEQAIGNVIGNALVHTPKQTQIVIDAALAEASVALRVTDNGPGIPPDALPHVFEKFAKAPISGFKADGGQSTGLGMAIAKGIMDAHGGTIEVQSPAEDGYGSRFTLTFPREVS
ncbi:MAG TPA: ATP-binding protein, partial [Pseudolabrys sp.]|nr:ATP-binding protein [Pseudolabrys sp.]